ncbi:hypothetical protein DFH06DRAFT_1313238 [Mycena polygramma]|nr:hypothetical protein DFH06DRAFT_1313238 [Mycena polygramma]
MPISMSMVEEWLRKTFCLLPPQLPMHHGDTEMAAPWDDDNNGIEDRWTRGELFQRKAAGYWADDERALTLARALPRVVNTPPHLAGLDTSSTSGSDRHRDQGVDRQREDMLRYQALSTRDRFHDEPVWGGRRPRYDPRNSRATYDYQEDRDHRDEREQEREQDREREREHERELERQNKEREDDCRNRDAMRKMPHWVPCDTRREPLRDAPRNMAPRNTALRPDARKDDKHRDASPPPRLFLSPNAALAPRDASFCSPQRRRLRRASSRIHAQPGPPPPPFNYTRGTSHPLAKPALPAIYLAF